MADERTPGDAPKDFSALLSDGDVRSGFEAPEASRWPRAVARKWMPVLFMGACLVYCARMTMPVCAVAMAATFRWNKIDTGVALGGFFWGYSCTAILGGHASDRIGGERVLLFSATSWAAVTAATPLLARLGSHSLALMTLARVLMGVLQGVFFPSLASLIAQRAPEGQKSFLSAIVQSGTSLGILLAGLLGSVMLDRYSWEKAFYAVGFLSGLWALVVWQYLPKGKPHPELKERRNDDQSKTFSWKRLLRLLRKPCIWSMVLAHTCTCGTSYTLLSWMPTYFSEQYPHLRTWVYNVVPWTAAIPAALCGGYVSDSLIGRRYSVAFVRKSMQFIAMGVSTAFVLLLSAKMSPPVAVICITAVMVSLSFTSCGSSVNVQDLTPSSAGALYGFMNMLGSFMGMLMVALSGYLIEGTDSWAPLFWLVGAVHVVGLAVFLCFGDARRVDLEDSNVAALD